MKKLLLSLCILLLTNVLNSCKDKCQETRLVRKYIPITHPLAEIRKGVKVLGSTALTNPGKIYVKGNYIYVNEVKEGIHIIDNTDPENPVNMVFIQIPGNGDLVVKNNTLYADSYTDLVSFDISDPMNAKEIGRAKNVFEYGNFNGDSWTYATENGEDALFLREYNIEYVTEVVTTDCDKDNEPLVYNEADNGGGLGGSMARFALYDQYLYTVGSTQLKVFDISEPTKPFEKNAVRVPGLLETIFPYKDKLFLGAPNGMMILDASDPAKPKYISIFRHFVGCDPVVVQDDIAYVTLRTGNACTNGVNQMELVDISDLTNPQSIKSYPMENPHGLSINFPYLYLCEGVHGLKVFNVADPLKVTDNLLAYKKDMGAYDVISTGKTLLLTGKDGIFQFDVSDPQNIREVSKIAVSK